MKLPPTTPALARIVNSLTQADHALDTAAFEAVRHGIPGWSQPYHYTFFGYVLAALSAGRPPSSALRLLVCGVYHGLDLALITHAAKLLGREIHLTGVDLFSAAPCADWPEEKRHLTWEQAFGCEPPSIEAARRHAPGAEIVQGPSVDYLLESARQFDFIYLDTSHDEQTVSCEIAAALGALKLGGLLAGDDYYQPGTCWGVDKAVANHLRYHVAFFNRIWLAQL